MQGNPENQNFLAPQREEKDNNNHFNLCPCFLGNRHLSNTSPSRERFSIAYQTGALCNCSLNVPQQSPHHVPLFRFILSYIFHPLSAFFILSFSPSCSHLYPFSEGFFFCTWFWSLCHRIIPVKQLWWCRLLLFGISLHRKVDKRLSVAPRYLELGGFVWGSDSDGFLQCDKISFSVLGSGQGNSCWTGTILYVTAKGC